MTDLRKLWAETFGTFWLVFGGCGSAIYAAAYPGLGIGFAGVSLAFGLTVLTMAYAVGHISGGHFNPAVTVGLWAGGRFAAKDVAPYVVAQVVGAIIAAFTLYCIAKGAPGWELGAGKLASNGYDAASPGKFALGTAFLVEVLLTGFFLLIIMGSTDRLATAAAAPIAIGLGLTLIHLISIPITNTSVNPARSTGPALVEGGVALHQLWLFWLAPLIGGVLGGLAYRTLLAEPD
jgi:aquaporin Z